MGAATRVTMDSDKDTSGRKEREEDIPWLLTSSPQPLVKPQKNQFGRDLGNHPSLVCDIEQSRAQESGGGGGPK